MRIIDCALEALSYLENGDIIAYPTEAVYGLGCDPFNEQAVEKLLALKQRDKSKGLILLIANDDQLRSLIDIVPEDRLNAVKATWPGHVTWVFPKSQRVPSWVSGDHHTVAIRMSAHPIAQDLCVNGPIISTSANLSGHEPALDIDSLYAQFPRGIDAVLKGALGQENKPSRMYDVLSGVSFRQ